MFAGSRTQDLMGLSIRLAGFEIRDTLGWIYGSGFPKNMDISKAIDKRREEDLEPQAIVAKWLVDRMAEREMTRKDISDHFKATNVAQQWTTYWTDGAVKPRVPKWDQWLELQRLLGFSDEMDAEVWRLNGRKGTPGEAWEKREVVGVQRRFNEPSGIVNIGQGQRVEIERKITTPSTPAAKQWEGWGTALKPAIEPIILARKPLDGTVANNVLTHGVGGLNIDACRVASDEVTGWKDDGAGGQTWNAGNMGLGKEGDARPVKGRFPANVLLDEHAAQTMDEQSCGASRFFPVFKYQAKAPKKERPVIAREDGTKIQHPTVKPLKLMEWLVTLTTPPGGVALDPFAGTGTTLQAAKNKGFPAAGIEANPDYCELIHKRLTTNTKAVIAPVE